jgi:peptidoglycan hydrolase-like protein with peptidoglycan-binding domain
VPTIDLANPGPWLEARRRSRTRRAETARRRRRLRLSRGGAAALLAGMTLAAGAAVAQDQTQTSGSSTRAGGSVVALQKALGIPADGVYGPQTAAAVRTFQRNHGLAVDGVAGPATMSALGISGSAAPSAPSGAGTSGAPGATLAKIAQCESGGDPTAVSASGTYRGKYQFSTSTWASVGGTGDPAAAPEAEQDQRAAMLYARSGAGQWPVCG